MRKSLTFFVCFFLLFTRTAFGAQSEQSTIVIQEKSLSTYKILLLKNADNDYPFLRIVDLSNDSSLQQDSNPLPLGTTIEWADIETIALHVNNNHLYVKKSDRFGWALVGMNDYEFGYNFLCEGNYFYSNVGYTYGDHPYGHSISDVDFFSLPLSKEEMLDLMSQAEWGHILNSSGCSMLYDSPDNSTNNALVLFNGVPVKIIDEASDWLNVQIGDSLFGFVQKRDVKRGGFISENESNFPELYFSLDTIVYSFPNLQSEQRCKAKNIEDLVVGKYSDEWYLVITLDGMSGFVNRNDLLCEK